MHYVASEEFRDVTSACGIPQLCVPCSKKHFQPHRQVYVNGVKGEGLRDTGADMIVVWASLVLPKAKAYTGDSLKVRMAEASHACDLNTAVIKVVTPLFAGTIVAVVMDDPPCDLLIGNRVQFVDGVIREVPVYRTPDVISVLTRPQAERENQPLKPLPAVRAALGNITPVLLAKVQDTDLTLATPREHAKLGKVKFSGKHGRSKFLRDKKLLYREFSNRQGPFEVTAKVGRNDYRIMMNGKPRLYHANLLRAYVERTAYGKKDKPQTEKIAVVMAETTDEEGRCRVPVCPLETREDYTDVHISSDLGDDQKADLQEIVEDAARVLTDLPLQTHLEEVES